MSLNLLQSQRSARELEQRLLELKNKNLSTTQVENYLLLAYIRGKEVEKAEDLWQVSISTREYSKHS